MKAADYGTDGSAITWISGITLKRNGTNNAYVAIGGDPPQKLEVFGDVRINGNLGIGVVPDATTKLKVCGIIGAKEVVVDLSDFCDFVFEDDYKRMTFEEKEGYLKSNKHLPYISSGTEMIKNGLPLKETLT